MAEIRSGGGERRGDILSGWVDPMDKIAGNNTSSLFEESFKESLGSVEERQAIYKDLANQMLSGIPLDPQEILILTYGMKWDDKEARPIELDGLISQLTRQEEMNPGSTQVENIVSGTEREAMFEVKEQVFPFLGGFSGGQRITTTAATKGPGVFSRMTSHLSSHPWRMVGTAGAAAGVLGFSLNPGGGESIYGVPPGDSLEGSPDTREITEEEIEDLSEEEFERLKSSIFNREIIVIDPSTGREIPITRYDADRLTEEGNVDTVSGGNFSPALIAMAQSMGMTPEELSVMQVAPGSDFGTINPWMFGEIKVPFNTFPYGVDISTGEAYRTPRTRSEISPAVAARLPKEDLTAAAISGTVVPPGGQINPKSFDTYQDNTLLHMVAETAEIYNVPVELLYGLINAESGFATNAMSPDGTRVGLAQIDLELHPHISVAQAQNPLFAIRWAGREVKRQTIDYGSWEAGIVSQFDPAEAEFLAEFGMFESPYAKAFVSDVFTYAGSSGMGKYMLDPDSLPKVAPPPRSGSGSSGGGIKLPAYQAPDPALLTQIVRGTYETELGRKPIGDESQQEVDRLGSWYKDKYNADIAKIQGKTSTAVDPQAQFEEYIKGLGEYGYREDSRSTRDIMAFMGEIVRIMQGV